MNQIDQVLSVGIVGGLDGFTDQEAREFIENSIDEIYAAYGDDYNGIQLVLHAIDAGISNISMAIADANGLDTIGIIQQEELDSISDNQVIPLIHSDQTVYILNDDDFYTEFVNDIDVLICVSDGVDELSEIMLDLALGEEISTLTMESKS